MLRRAALVVITSFASITLPAFSETITVEAYRISEAEAMAGMYMPGYQLIRSPDAIDDGSSQMAIVSFTVPDSCSGPNAGVKASSTVPELLAAIAWANGQMNLAVRALFAIMGQPVTLALSQGQVMFVPVLAGSPSIYAVIPSNAPPRCG